MRWLAIVALAAGPVLSGVWGDDGSGGAAAARGLTRAPTPVPTEAPAPPPAPEPIRLTIGVSGDLLPHLPVVARARALAGGRGYDFRPLLRPIRRWVRRNSLAFCHVETPLTSAAPAGYPRFNAPPALARAVKETGFDACSTASNHSLKGISRAFVRLSVVVVPVSRAAAQKCLAWGFRSCCLSCSSGSRSLP